MIFDLNMVRKQDFIFSEQLKILGKTAAVLILTSVRDKKVHPSIHNML